MDFDALKAPFPQNCIHWRAQTVTKKGDKAMALAYLDSRDVQERLDAVCGPEHWQAIHYDCGDGKLGCKIGVRIGEEWVWKGDGAGNTDIEAEKGAFSSALKRAAVLWGVGRYLYDLPAPWVPCEAYESGGKMRFKRFTDDPWKHVRQNTSQPQPAASTETKTSQTKSAGNIEVIDADGQPVTYKRTKRGALDAMAFLEKEIDNVAEIDAQVAVWSANAETFRKLAETVGDLAPESGAQTIKERVEANDTAFRKYMEAAE